MGMLPHRVPLSAVSEVRSNNIWQCMGMLSHCVPLSAVSEAIQKLYKYTTILTLKHQSYGRTSNRHCRRRGGCGYSCPGEGAVYGPGVGVIKDDEGSEICYFSRGEKDV